MLDTLRDTGYLTGHVLYNLGTFSKEFMNFHSKSRALYNMCCPRATLNGMYCAYCMRFAS